VKSLRGQRHSAFSESTAGTLAEHISIVQTAVRGALRAGHFLAGILGHSAFERITRTGSALGIPAWSIDMPRAARSMPVTSREGAHALYFPTCLTRVFGPIPGGPSVAELIVAVSARAGAPVWIPPKIKGTCCGMPFSSKGYKKGFILSVNTAIERLWDWSSHAALPVVLDTSPCAFTLKTCRDALTEPNRKRYDSLKILDSIEYARDVVLPGLIIRRRTDAAAVHPVCSVQKMGLSTALRDIAAVCAEKAYVPVEAGCCGFAGDRGFLFPELTEAATRAEAAEIARHSFSGYFSSSRTCEIGMSRATGRSWTSFWALLDEASR